jgi:hypothetical protein
MELIYGWFRDIVHHEITEAHRGVIATFVAKFTLS